MLSKDKYTVEIAFVNTSVKNSFQTESISNLENKLKMLIDDLETIDTIQIKNNYPQVGEVYVDTVDENEPIRTTTTISKELTEPAPKKKESIIQQWRNIIDPEEYKTVFK